MGPEQDGGWTTGELRNYIEDVPGWASLDQVEVGTTVVDVGDIVGGNGFSSSAYDGAWTLKGGPDPRYDRAMEFMARQRTRARNGVVDPGHVHLFKIYSDRDGKDVYYVCVDGHRRVSCAKHLGIKKIKAIVTELVPGKARD